MKRWKQLILAFGIVAGLSATAVPAGNVAAINVLNDQCTAVKSASPICAAAKKDNVNKSVQTIVSTMFVILGILSVIMIIVGGIRYTISNGDSSRIKGAKDTVTYAVVGLIVALLAFTIVNFVIGKF